MLFRSGYFQVCHGHEPLDVPGGCLCGVNDRQVPALPTLGLRFWLAFGTEITDWVLITAIGGGNMTDNEVSRKGG